MREGPLQALDVIKEVTGEDEVNAIGYCVGGTLMAVTLAWMAAKRDKRIASATFFAAQVDFTYAGDLMVFVDEDQLKTLEKNMAERGYLEGKKMANAFNMLRSNDLIWPYVISNYLKGKQPYPFDLLYWNSDSTRMPAANHSFYLRNCYLENKLSKGLMVIDNERLDLGQVTIPVYNLATREDHIAPAKSAFLGSKVLRRSGQVRTCGFGAHRGRGQSAGQAEVSILDRRRAARQPRQVARGSDRASRLVVAGLGQMDQEQRQRDRPGTRAGWRQIPADRRRAGHLREGAGLKVFP